MAYAFETSLQRLNAAVGSRLANVQAVLDHRSVRVAFDNGTDQALGMEVRRPTAALPTSDVGRLTADTRIRIGGQVYRIAQHDDDGAGWTVLTLERAS